MDGSPCVVRLHDITVNTSHAVASSRLVRPGARREEGPSPEPLPPKGGLWCTESGRSFVEPEGLGWHQQRDHALRKPHGCPACGQAFAQLSSLRLHQQSCQHGSLGQEERLPAYQHLLQDGGPYACAPCGWAFSHKPALLQHQQAGCHTARDVFVLSPRAPTPPPSLPSPPVPVASSSPPLDPLSTIPTRLNQCSLCPRGFRSQAGLACHQRLSHPAEWKRAQAQYWQHGGQRLPCPYCDKVFCHAPSLSQHMARCHGNEAERGTGAKLFPCRSCDAVFTQTSTLYLHRKEKHRREGPRERCRTTCARPKKANVKVKSKPKAYPCPFCSSVFPHHLSRWAHMRASHQQLLRKKGRSVSMPQLEQTPRGEQFHKACRVSSNRNQRLSMHLEAVGVEGKGAKDDEGKVEGDGNFPCPSCEEVFDQLSALRVHQEIHLPAGVGRACGVCQGAMSFSRTAESQLARFYHCVPCGRAFRTLQVFLRHCQAHLLPSAGKEDVDAKH